MTARLKRREFIKTAAASAGAAAGLGLLDLPYLLAAPAPTGDKAKVRVAMIGCGGRGVSAHVPELARQNLVAVVDPDEKHIGDALKKAGQEKGVDTAKIKTYSDYRKFFDEMNKEVDAIFVATPNHHHALPSLIAMSHGIGVYVEKPMAFNIWEARTMAIPMVTPSPTTAWGLDRAPGLIPPSALAVYDCGAPPLPLTNTPPPKTACAPAGRSELHDLPAHVAAGRRQMAEFYATGQIVDECGLGSGAGSAAGSGTASACTCLTGACN